MRSAHGAPCCSRSWTIVASLHNCDPPANSPKAMVLLVPSAMAVMPRTWLVTIAPWLPPTSVPASAITSGGVCRDMVPFGPQKLAATRTVGA